MTPEQVREAAERLTCCLHHEITADDLKIICRYILSTIHADDHMPVMADWLMEHWGFTYMEDDEEFFLETENNQYSVVLHKNNIATFYLDAVDCDAWPHDIHTRHQFRLLATALEIQPKR